MPLATVNYKAAMRTADRKKEIERENLILLQKLERIKFGPLKRPSDIGLPARSQSALPSRVPNRDRKVLEESSGDRAIADAGQLHVSAHRRPDWNGAPSRARRAVAPLVDQGRQSTSPNSDECPLSRIDVRELRNILREENVEDPIAAVFEALMLIVSPFDVDDVDATWEGVRHWVKQLGGTDVFVRNLMRFDPCSIQLDNANEAR